MRFDLILFMATNYLFSTNLKSNRRVKTCPLTWLDDETSSMLYVIDPCATGGPYEDVPYPNVFSWDRTFLSIPLIRTLISWTTRTQVTRLFLNPLTYCSTTFAMSTNCILFEIRIMLLAWHSNFS